MQTYPGIYTSEYSDGKTRYKRVPRTSYGGELHDSGDEHTACDAYFGKTVCQKTPIALHKTGVEVEFFSHIVGKVCPNSTAKAVMKPPTILGRDTVGCVRKTTRIAFHSLRGTKNRFFRKKCQCFYIVVLLNLNVMRPFFCALFHEAGCNEDM